ncbi:MAG TPA: sulfite exporter TauE/SafE family protein [Opitutaceae bacterium]|nr:sulfite exporter TauE/SafE family protein [Opitutaceae bacterium]
MSWEPWQWALAVTAAFLVGVSKTGISGLGMLFVVMFAQIMPAKQATGIVLPLLCFGDLVAVASYRQHANWSHLWKLFPWTAGGVVLGFLAMNRIDEHQARLLIGGIVIGLIGLHLVRRRRSGGGETEHGIWFAPLVGVLAGFTTLVANAAGPLMAIYLLAMRLPKMEYMGTGAVFFMLLNLFKVPFMTYLGLINAHSFSLNLWLAPAVFAGALVGRKLLATINQRWFENLALALSALAAVDLVFKVSTSLVGWLRS